MLSGELLLEEELLLEGELLLEELLLEEELAPALPWSWVFPPQAARSNTMHVGMPIRGLERAALRGKESTSMSRPLLVVFLWLDVSTTVPRPAVDRRPTGRSRILREVPLSGRSTGLCTCLAHCRRNLSLLRRDFRADVYQEAAPRG